MAEIKRQLQEFVCMSNPSQMADAQRPPRYYRWAIGIAKPFYRCLLWYRHQCATNPYYEQEIADRFGKRYQSIHTIHKINTHTQQMAPYPNKNQGLIWVHAVSLGETNTIAPMVHALLSLGFDIYLTNTTHTGYARVRSLFADDIAKGRVHHGFVPVDIPKVIQAFLAKTSPVAALFVETELWANTLYELKRQRIATFLVNARLSVKSGKRYRTFAKLSQSMMHNLTGIIVQDTLSAQRFMQLGANKTMLTQAPSLKWQIQPNHGYDKSLDFCTLLQGHKTLQGYKTHKRPIYVLGSSHAGEEAFFLAVHKGLLTHMSQALLILVPRHPERFEQVANLLDVSGLTWQRRSDDPKRVIDNNTQIYLADSMGELIGFYQLADVAVVGGSFVNVGGHNPIEAAQFGIPIIMGTYTQSCQNIVEEFIQVGALWQLQTSHYNHVDLSKELTNFNATFQTADIHDESSTIQSAVHQVINQLQIWLNQPKLAKQAGKYGKALVHNHQQALTQQMQPILTAIHLAQSGQRVSRS